jgi:hypothetical protein
MDKDLIYVEHYWTNPDPKSKDVSTPASPLQKTYVFMNRKTYEFKTFTIAGDGSVPSPLAPAVNVNGATDNDNGNGAAPGTTIKVKDALTQCTADHLKYVIAGGFHKAGLLDMIRMIITDDKKIFETHLNEKGTNRLIIANDMLTSLNTKITRKDDLMQMLQNVFNNPKQFNTTELLGLLGENKTCQRGKGQLFVPTEEALVGLRDLRKQLKGIEPQPASDEQTIESVYSPEEIASLETDDRSVLTKETNVRKRPRGV